MKPDDSSAWDLAAPLAFARVGPSVGAASAPIASALPIILRVIVMIAPSALAHRRRLSAMLGRMAPVVKPALRRSCALYRIGAFRAVADAAISRAPLRGDDDRRSPSGR